jgi:soluble lytic murein transglycosylase-like protein
MRNEFNLWLDEIDERDLRPHSASRFFYGAIAFMAVCLLAFCALAILAGTAQAQVPREALHYRAGLVRNARLVWGLDAPVATFAGQIHQESRWRHEARSAYADGLAQFTPDTVRWIAGAYPSELGAGDAFNPAWALRALVRYDRHLWERAPAGAPPCDRMAFVLAGYNGGAGWIARDRAQARAAGADPDRWWGAVERYNAGRAAAFFRENRDYPRLILLAHEPRYVAAGFGAGSCA